MRTARALAAIEAHILEAPQLWLPGEGARLAGDLWERETFGLDSERYGSVRWLSRDPSAVRRVLQLVPIGDAGAIIEAPDATLVIHCAALDLKVLSAIPAGGDTLIGSALALLNVVPGLTATLGALVRSIHLLQATGPGYDISHSHPELPFSVFVSLPLGEPSAALRLAESLLHEAMHLQLSLVEAKTPLVAEPDAGGWSPWQRCERPIIGLLHGLYVFAVIDEVLTELLARDALTEIDRALAMRRRLEIVAEAAELKDFAGSEALTPFGRAFTRRLLAAIRAPSGNRESSS